MIFFFPTATQWQACAVLMAAIAFAARRIGVFFATGIKEENGTGDSGWENGFRLLATERRKTPNSNSDGNVRTSNDDKKKARWFQTRCFQITLCETLITICAQIQFNAEICRMPLRARKSVTHPMMAEVSKGAAALREACAAEPAYQTADDLWNGLKRNDLAAQLVLTFAQRVRFNKRTRHSLPARKRQEDKRWVRILRQQGWKLYLLMRQRAVPNRKKPGNTTTYVTQTERRTKVRLGQVDSAADTVDEQAAAALKVTSTLVLASCCVLWIDNWYRAQYTTHPDESEWSQNCTAMAVLQLKQRSIYWAGHPAIG